MGKKFIPKINIIFLVNRFTSKNTVYEVLGFKQIKTV
jgi:hypothetical protein